MGVFLPPWKIVCSHGSMSTLIVPGIRVTGGSPAAPAEGCSVIKFLHLVGGRRVPNMNDPLQGQGTGWEQGIREIGRLSHHGRVFYRILHNCLESKSNVTEVHLVP